jgi:5-methylcytosine-specific restriction endonuclease McrA
MISIATPSDSAQQIYTACAERTQDPVLRAALKAEGVRVTQRSEIYLSKAAAEKLYSMTPDNAQNVSNTKLAELYERVLVKGGERSTYDRLKSLARFARCPLCGQRDVKTLDHYLPRASFPEFCVTPANLVPSCTDCNKAKLDYVADRYERQSFHPYFDDWSGVILVKAAPVIADRVDVIFSIDRHGDIPPPWVERAEWHFRLLNLGNLYREHASVELVQRKSEFRDTYSVEGSSGLKEDLRIEADSRSKPFPNAWQPALYRGLSASEEFCDGGFEKIEE